MTPADNKKNHGFLFSNYARAPMNFVRGEGAWLFDDKDEKWLDFGSGIAVNALGHSHPHLVEQLKQQADKLWHTSNLYQSELQIRLATRLAEETFADKVFFCNSGAEANEGAIKTARRYFYDLGQTERVDIITFEGAFHGRTLATIAAGGQEKYLEGFGPKAAGFVQVPFGDEEALKAAIGPSTAAILIEPVQGEGGLRHVPAAHLRLLRELCDEHGILLIFDEVQSGAGRTGYLFAYQASGVEPDILASAKGLGGGFPIGAVLASDKVAACMVPGTHGTTFGGNMLAMAAGNAVLDVVLSDGFLDEVKEKAGFFRQRLSQVIDEFPDIVQQVMGEGLMSGLKCAAPVGELVAAVQNEKLLGVPAGNNVLRLMPPLTVSQDELNECIARLQKAFAAYQAKQKA